MKRQITAVFTAMTISVLSVSAAFARETNYFGEFEMPATNFSDIKYERYDMEKFNSLIRDIRELIKRKNREDRLLELLENTGAEITDAATMYSIAYLNESKDNSKENNAERETAFDFTTDMDKAYRELCGEIAKSSYRPALEEFFGSAEALEEFLGNNHTDKYYELVDEEQAIISEYRENEFGAYVLVTDEGEELRYDDILDLVARYAEGGKSGKNDERQIEYGRLRKLISDYYAQSGKILSDIYLRLVRLRTEIAKEEGYDNYADYAYEKLYYRDYSTSEARSFSENVGLYVKDASEAALSAAAYFDSEDIDMTDEEILDTVGKNVYDISDEMGRAFDYMLEYNMYDMDYSENKISQGSAYTTYLYSFGTPYLFMSPQRDDAQWKLDSFTHEFGHFNAMLYEPAYRKISIAQASVDAMEDKGISIDLAEINSQGLELLMTNYYGSLYGQDKRSRELNAVSDILYSAVSACGVNEFELWAYENPDMSIDELIGKGDGMWYIEHLFTSPLYYISYAASAMAALNIWEDMKEKGFDEASDKYLRLCAAGDYMPFRETVKECGFDDIFTEEYSKHIGDMINNQFGFKYEDLSRSDWYYKPVFEMMEYIPSDSDSSFGADTSAVRSVVAGSIAKMFGTDFDRFASGFSDVGEADDKYIGWAKENGIVEGYNDAVFGANDLVTREQAVVMLYRLAKHLGYSVPENSILDYTDSDTVHSWAYDAVVWADSRGIINGYEDKSFRPAENVTKGQLARMLYKFADLIL